MSEVHGNKVGFEILRTDGRLRHLNVKVASNGARLYYFTAGYRSDTACDLPDGYEAVEDGPRTYVRKIKGA